VTSIGAKQFERHDPGSEFVIEFYEVEAIGEPRCIEHDEVSWVAVSDLLSYELAPSDKAFAEFLLHHSTKKYD
jgi:8-oxo-dGTP pyrophosphatase MutT (NUDIX family)